MTLEKVKKIKQIFDELDGKLWAIQTGDLDSYIEDAVEEAKRKVLLLIEDCKDCEDMTKDWSCLADKRVCLKKRE